MNNFKKYLIQLRNLLYLIIGYDNLETYEEYLKKNKGKKLQFKIKRNDYYVYLYFRVKKYEIWRPYFKFIYNSSANDYEIYKKNFSYETYAYKFIEEHPTVDDILVSFMEDANYIRKEIEKKNEYKRSLNIY